MANNSLSSCSKCSGLIPRGGDQCALCGAPSVASTDNSETMNVTNVPIYGAPPQIESGSAEDEETEPVDREMAFLKKILSYFRGI